MDIVKCKDCKHRPIKDGEHIYRPDVFDLVCPYLCDDMYYNRMPKDDWFCNFGEKKSG